MAKAPYTTKTAASGTKASGRMATTMAKAPTTIKTAARSTKASGIMANLLSDDAVCEARQSER